MGQVYKARHLTLGKPFALKIIAPAFANDQVARTRFNDEAKLASEISHPNIISVVDFGEDPDLGAYMVMELVDGERLFEVEGSAQMSIKRAIDVLAQVADALEHIHKRGIIHGDVKAENILLVAEADAATARRRRTVRLLDFGLARRRGSHEEVVSGSPGYLAPERVMGGPPTIATDIYALGVLGYLLFTRSLPFEGSVVETLMAQVHETPPSLESRRGEPVDDAIDTLIARAMHKDPQKRHPSAAAFRYEINAVMDMLDMRRRTLRTGRSMKAIDRREAMLATLFEHSHLPQALIDADGKIGLANGAFAKLIGCTNRVEGQRLADTALAASLPGIENVIFEARRFGEPMEIRAEVGRIELDLWLAPSPLASEEVHLLVRAHQRR
jgi:serine/threonine protein kinase